MDGPAYRRRANDRGDFSSPGRGQHNQSMSLAGAQARFKDSVWKLGSQRVSEYSVSFVSTMLTVSLTGLRPCY